MNQKFQYRGVVASIYSSSAGNIAFGEVIHHFVNQSYKAMIFDAIPSEQKGTLAKRTTTPKDMTTELMLNPPHFDDVSSFAWWNVDNVL